ncbi:hypothetical protein IAT40_001807 [Kwoniella sp. CBS 6097]
MPQIDPSEGSAAGRSRVDFTVYSESTAEGTRFQPKVYVSTEPADMGSMASVFGSDVINVVNSAATNQYTEHVYCRSTHAESEQVLTNLVEETADYAERDRHLDLDWSVQMASEIAGAGTEPNGQ